MKSNQYSGFCNFICACVCFCCFFSTLYSQTAASYVFTPSSSSYVPLTMATTATISGTVDEGYFNGIPMGFNFAYCGTNNYTLINVSTNGWMTLGTSTANNNIGPGNTGAVNNFTSPPLSAPIIAPLWDNNALTSNTDISYKHSGTAPNRITTVEYRRVKCTFNATPANVEFQVVFHETSGVIQFKYRVMGGNYSADASAGLSIGIASSAAAYLSLNNAGSSPTASSTVNTMAIVGLPVEDQMYTFTPSGNPLSVNWIDFTAVLVEVDNNVQLDWTTGSEMNNDYFAIERTTDGITFLKMGEVKGSGTTGNIHRYLFTDQKIPLNENLYYYYRLKQVDYNGDFTYSQVRAIAVLPAEAQLTVFPNPFQNDLFISFDKGNKGPVTLTIVNQLGEVMAAKEIGGLEVLNPIQLDASDFAQGIYFVKMNVSNVNSIVRVVKE